MGDLSDCDYTSLLYSPMDPFFDTPVVPSTEPQTRKPFADARTTPTSMLSGPLDVPEYNLPNVPVNLPIETADANDVFARDMSPTPSLCADGDDSSARSPPSLKRSFYSSSSDSSNGNDEDYDEAPVAKRPKRRPGRPRLERTSSTPSASSSSSSKTQQQRVPHNQVERKYREGLNTQLEQLCRAVPALRQVNDGERGKPSKATVLVGAIAYIKSIERERDELVSELQRRRMSNGAVGVEGWL